MTTAVGIVSVQARVAGLHAMLAALDGTVPVDGTRSTGTVSTGGTTGAGFDELLANGAPSGSGEVLSIAEEYLGVPYVYGGTDPKVGLDCSGFVQLVFRRAGIALPRVTYDQVHAGTPVSSLAEARPGDLIFGVGDRGQRVNGHVGIYLGAGKWIVAPKTGDVVKIADVPSDVTAIRRVLPQGASVSGGGW